MSIFMSYIIMILLISLLVIVHELGHFLAAKMFGVGVSKFGFGLPFGPTLFKTKMGETEIFVHAFLLGGYVSFIDDEEGVDIPEDSPKKYKNKPVWQRATIVSAGVFSNVICAIVLVMLAAAIWGKLPAGEHNIYVKRIFAEKGAPVYDIGLKEGDLIKSINGSAMIYPTFVNKYAQASKKFNDYVSPERIKEKTAELIKLNPELSGSDMVKKGTALKLPEFTLEEPVKLTDNYLRGIEKPDTSSVKLSAAQQKLRDELYGKSAVTTDRDLLVEDVAMAVSDTQSPLFITVVRNEKEIELKPLLVDESGIIGIEQAIEEILTPTKNLKDIAVKSLVYIYDSTMLILIGLAKLFTGHIPLRDLHGIIVITKIGSDIIQYAGLFKGILLTAIISMNLAIINLLPIPALDGGHLLFLAIEKIKGRAVDEKILEKINSISFLILISLLFLILFNDIFALMSGKF